VLRSVLYSGVHSGIVFCLMRENDVDADVMFCCGRRQTSCNQSYGEFMAVFSPQRLEDVRRTKVPCPSP
jgi:hypothetical protein